jgi:hypothetical protein
VRRPVGTVAALALVLAALGLVALGARSDAARFRVTTVATEPATPVPPTATPSPAGSASPVSTEDPDPGDNRVIGLTAVLYFAVAVLALVAVVVLLAPRTGRPGWRRRRAEPAAVPDEPAEASTQALAEAVEQGLREVEQGEPTDAVVACWLRLERAAADAGTVRRAAETAGELTARVLAAHRVDPGTLRRLADLYREARFSDHVLGEPERERARQALDQVRRELRGDRAPAGGSA